MIDLAPSASTRETARLLLRPLQLGDASHLEHLFKDDWDAVKQTGRLPFPATVAAMQGWIRQHTGQGGHAFFLLRKCDHEPIGAIGFGGEGPIRELGYILGRAFWGQGYATEAVGSMIEAARDLGLAGLQAYSFIENPASSRVLEKAGFTLVGVIIREYAKRGGMRRVNHFKKMF